MSKDANPQQNIRKKLFESSNSFNLQMTPLIDIVFLLLIFFLVAANWKAEESYLPLKLPEARGGEEFLITEPVRISLSQSDGGCLIRLSSRKKVMLTEETLEQDIDQFTTELKNLLKEQKRYYSDPVELYCRDEVEWLYIARIYNVLFGLGMSDVTFAVGAG